VRWWTPEELAEIGAFAEGLGFAHVEAGPLVRSSYHARRAVDAAEDHAGDSRHAEPARARFSAPKTPGAARIPA
jgi:lipoic acid synthetase